MGTVLNYMNAAMESEHLIRDTLEPTLEPVTAKEWPYMFVLAFGILSVSLSTDRKLRL